MTDRNKKTISEMFDKLAENYDRNNNIISLFTHKIIKYLVIANIGQLPQNPKILDLCTGTGDVAGFLARKYKDATVIGADFSKEMLNIARKKHPDIDFVYADCLNLPFNDNTFDLITMSFGLRNTENYDKAIEGVARVLKHGGIFVHLDFDKKSKLADFVFEKLVRLFRNKEYRYLLNSKKEFPDSAGLIKMFEKAGLKYKNTKEFLFGIISAQYMEKL